MICPFPTQGSGGQSRDDTTNGTVIIFGERNVSNVLECENGTVARSNNHVQIVADDFPITSWIMTTVTESKKSQTLTV